MEFLFTKEVAQRMGDLERGHHVGVGELAATMYHNLEQMCSKETNNASNDVVFCEPDGPKD
jgi:hypothetical protein